MDCQTCRDIFLPYDPGVRRFKAIGETYPSACEMCHNPDREIPPTSFEPPYPEEPPRPIRYIYDSGLKHIEKGKLYDLEKKSVQLEGEVHWLRSKINDHITKSIKAKKGISQAPF